MSARAAKANGIVPLQKVGDRTRGSWSAKDYLSVLNLSRAELLDVLDLSASLKRDRHAGRSSSQPLTGKHVALLFEKPSLRTRVTFEVGIVQLGGRAVHLSGSEIGLGTRETVPDVARNLSRWVDGIAARAH